MLDVPMPRADHVRVTNLWRTTINTRLQMVCTFIGTFCKYTNLHYAELSVLLVGGRLRWPGDLVLKSAGGVASWKTAGSVALHGRAQWGVLFSEAR
jgi:hypothetical protein